MLHFFNGLPPHHLDFERTCVFISTKFLLHRSLVYLFILSAVLRTTPACAEQGRTPSSSRQCESRSRRGNGEYHARNLVRELFMPLLVLTGRVAVPFVQGDEFCFTFPGDGRRLQPESTDSANTRNTSGGRILEPLPLNTFPWRCLHAPTPLKLKWAHTMKLQTQNWSIASVA